MHRIKINNDLVFPIFPKKIIFLKKLNFLSIHDGFVKVLFRYFFKCNLLILLSTYFPNLTFYECIIHVQYNNYFTLETSHPTFLSDGVKQ